MKRITNADFEKKTYYLLNLYIINTIIYSMRTLIDFSILQEYNQKVLPHGDKLSALVALIDWNAFLPMENTLFKNKSERGEIHACRSFPGDCLQE
jgi:hypothetical protein